MKGRLIDIQNLSVHDGEGIRTTVFFAGCPLRCAWCANPESQALEGGEWYGVEDIVEWIKRQLLFYRCSGGGVTFSGGEATMQPEMLGALTDTLYDLGVDLALETCGYFDFKRLKPVLEKLNLIFVDLKVMDDAAHLRHTGVSNGLILNNLKSLNTLHVPIVVRIPVIEGVNADESNILATAAFVKAYLSQPKIELLPYHTLGMYKYEALGLTCPPETFKTPSRERLVAIQQMIEAAGVEVVSYR